MRGAGLFALLPLCFSLAACLPSDFRQSVTPGLITSGERFGVTIGMSREDARDILLADPQKRPTRDGPCEGRGCDGADHVDNYRIDSVAETGYIEVYSRNGIVTRIRWYAVDNSLG